MTSRRGTCAVAAGLAILAAAAAPGAQPPAGPEVRQIVTFHFQPGRAAEAIGIYRDRLLPIYRDTTPLLRFRAYREAESPEPLDLVIVSAYAGMAGMDAGNQMLRKPHRTGESAFALYGLLSGLTQSHHDQFVEMIPALSDRAVEGADLTVFEYVRVAPGAHEAFERMLAAAVRDFERERSLYAWSETGRMIVADGWDYLRLFGISNLGEWHAYVTAVRGAAFQAELAPLVTARKTIVLRNEPSLAVR